jgi:hypothetical protein
MEGLVYRALVYVDRASHAEVLLALVQPFVKNSRRKTDVPPASGCDTNEMLRYVLLSIFPLAFQSSRRSVYESSNDALQSGV